MKHTPKTIYLKDYKPSDYLIDSVKLDIQLQPTRTKVKAQLQMRPNPEVHSKSKSKRKYLQLDGEHLELQRLAVNRKKLDPSAYKVSKKGLKILQSFSEPFTLDITTLCDPENNKSLSGLYRSQGVYCTQCEAQGFRRLTYYLDRPDILAEFTTRIEAEQKTNPILLSNGNPVEMGPARKKGWRYAVWYDPHPKPSYLFALVGGDLACVTDHFKTKSGREVELRIYVEPGKEDRCKWAMDSLKRSMRWDEKRFGLEYDLDVFMIVAVSDFNMGAMENKGLNIFNDKLILARPDTATDNDYIAIESVIAHEYFHNWTGNRITCRDWFQLCLKEGLTVFRDQEFTSDLRSRIVKRIQDVRLLRTHQFPEDAGPLAHPVRPDAYMEINNFYTATVYEKGAELCRMLFIMLGQQGFRKGMDLYFARHDGEAATVEDFIQAMEDANSYDLTQFMYWYHQAGTPQLLCKYQYNKRTQTASLDFHQVSPKTPGQVTRKPLHIPIKLAMLDDTDQNIPLELDDNVTFEDNLFHLKSYKDKVVIKDLSARPIPSVLRGFSAPVELNLDLSDDDLEFLMAKDSDLFNRWQAAQDYSIRILSQHLARKTNRKQIKNAKRFADAVGQTLQATDLEDAFKAEFLRLPSEADIAGHIGSNIDPHAIHMARKQLLDMIAQELNDLLWQIYKTSNNRGRYTPTAKSVGKRSLRNMALALLGGLQTPDSLQLAENHYYVAKNMTDQMAALTVLSDAITDVREDVFDHFYETWKDDHLVIDKWFMLQAISSHHNTLERMKELRQHPKFSIKNPNKVRALFGAFTQGNPQHFNRLDGQGYMFVAEAILEIDRFNPQIAARLSNAFRSWKILEPKRRHLAKQQLEHIMKDKKLSKDTYEIVSRTLGES